VASTASQTQRSVLAPADRRRLERHLAGALRRARARRGEALAAVTIALGPDIDPTAAVLASRRAGEDWWVLERPDAGGQVLAALGCVRRIEAQGVARFATVAAAWRTLADTADADRPTQPRGAGPVAVGGFAFAPDGGTDPGWAGYPAASLQVPELSLARQDGNTALTLTAVVSADDTVEHLGDRLQRRLAELRLDRPLPLLDPHPTGRHHVVSPLSPEHYESAVGRAIERIAAGELEKVVLAREVAVHAPAEPDPGALLGVLREGFAACFVFAVGRGDATFLAASPELLVRREGHRASTVALAGSARRSADPAVDDHLGEELLRSAKDRHEHAIVARRIAAALRPHALWVTAAPEPQIVRVANIQHLATAIRAQLDTPLGAVDLAGLLHPTPAVGGEPHDRAERLIRSLEGMDRGWYAGAVGWTDMAEDGDFCVALRCALLRGQVARCYAGVGVVGDSDPAAELAETEVKLSALLPLLAG